MILLLKRCTVTAIVTTFCMDVPPTFRRLQIYTTRNKPVQLINISRECAVTVVGTKEMNCSLAWEWKPAPKCETGISLKLKRCMNTLHRTQLWTHSPSQVVVCGLKKEDIMQALQTCSWQWCSKGSMHATPGVPDKDLLWKLAPSCWRSMSGVWLLTDSQEGLVYRPT